MALQDQCTPDDQTAYLPEPPPFAIPRIIFEQLLPCLNGHEFKVACYLLYLTAESNYAEPGWATVAVIAAATRETKPAVRRALEALQRANVVLCAHGEPAARFRLNMATRTRPVRPLTSALPRRDGDVLRRLAARYGYRCLACGATDALLEADHIVPRSQGGPDTLPNRQLLCGPCNRAKRTRTIDYRPHDDQGGA